MSEGEFELVRGHSGPNEKKVCVSSESPATNRHKGTIQLDRYRAHPYQPYFLFQPSGLCLHQQKSYTFGRDGLPDVCMQWWPGLWWALVGSVFHVLERISTNAIKTGGGTREGRNIF